MRTNTRGVKKRRKRKGRGTGLTAGSDPAGYTRHFSYRRGRLHCEGVGLEKIAKRAGTPAYVYSRASFAGAYRELAAAIRMAYGPSFTLCYAVKANSNLSVLRVFARLGSGFDIVSGGELYRVLRIGVSPRRVVFSGVGKTREEIREALREGILLFNVESEAELELLAAEASRHRRAAPAAIRVNPDVAADTHPHISTGRRVHKFGVDWRDARRLYLAYKNSRWIHWRGLSAHIGSQILSLAPFRRALKRLGGYLRELGRAGIELNYFDFGGGIGIRYSDERPLKLAPYARAIRNAIAPTGCHLLLEPGRVLVGAAGVLLLRVLYTKNSVQSGKKFVVVDTAMNDFARPILYGALHPITSVRRSRVSASAKDGARGLADIVGPVCETGDCFIQDWPIGEVEPGDLLVLWGAGAYGFVSSSNYNSRRRAAEVLVDGNRFRVIRRRESRADLIRGEML